MVPLETIPMYSPNAYLTKYWTADRNATQWSNFIKELVVSNNELTRLKLEALAPKLPGAHIGKEGISSSPRSGSNLNEQRSSIRTRYLPTFTLILRTTSTALLR